jgi:hypothetical protein
VDFVGAAVSNIVGIVTLCLFVAGVMKIFQMATTLNEIKDLLQRERREERPIVPSPLASTAPSGEEMLRALDRDLRMTEEPGIDPEVVNPR